MAKKTAPLLPATEELLYQFGARLRMARRRRRLTAKLVAERAGMAPMTLRSLERGGSGVTVGAYLAVMQALGIERDLDLLGKADPVGRELQDAQWSVRTKTSRTALLISGEPPAPANQPGLAAAAAAPPRTATTVPKDAPDRVRRDEVASAEELVGLLDLSASPAKRVR